MSDYERIASLISGLHAAPTQPSLEDMANEVGLSTFHFQRMFRIWVGISPKRYLQNLAAARAKARLDDAQTVLDTAYDIGLSGPSRLHDLFVSIEALTPGQYKNKGKGVQLDYGVHWTPFGPCLLAQTGRGITCLHFLEDDEDPIDFLRTQWANADIVHSPQNTAPIAYTIFHASERADQPFHLNLRGTNFQVQVWRALLKIPEGQTRSYGELAQAMDLPTTHARAVANAIGSNPVAYLIPCHRVIRESGALGGYRWGLTRKERLLALEQTDCP